MSPYVMPGLKKTKIKQDLIISAVMKMFDLTREELFRVQRKREIVYPRHLCFHLLRQHTNLTVEGIGDLFGKHHTTVLHGLQTIQDLNPHVDLRALENEIGYVDFRRK